MKVLVTGSRGFIGRAVVEELQGRGDEVVHLDKPHNIASHSCWTGWHTPIDAVINLAGVLGTPELFGSEVEAAEVNIIGAIRAFDFAARLGIPLVQIGTGHKGQPNPYAITKGCAEDLGLSRAQWLGEKIAVVRAFHVYGPGQTPGPPHGPASVHKFFPTFACNALSGRPLELCGGGHQVIDPVHVSDVARVLVKAVKGPYGEVTQAGCGKPLSVREVAEDIRDAAGPTESELYEVQGRAGEPEGDWVVAAEPACTNPWPYLVTETIGYYREWLA